MTVTNFNYEKIIDILNKCKLKNGEKYFSVLQKLTSDELEKVKDFQNIYSQIVNPDNDKKVEIICFLMFFLICNVYNKYKKVKPYVSVEEDNYKFYIIQPIDGKYPLLDYLINKLIQNVQTIKVNNGYGNQYTFSDSLLEINVDRYNTISDEILKSILYVKSIFHETEHALHGNYFYSDNNSIIIPKPNFIEYVNNYSSNSDFYINEKKNKYIRNLRFYHKLSNKYNILKLNGTEKFSLCQDYEPQCGFSKSVEEASTEAEAVEFSRLKDMDYGFERMLGEDWYFYSNTPENAYSLAANYFSLFNKFYANQLSLFDTMYLGYDSYFLYNNINEEVLSKIITGMIQDGTLDIMEILNCFSQLYKRANDDLIDFEFLSPYLKNNDCIYTVKEYSSEFEKTEFPKKR